MRVSIVMQLKPVTRVPILDQDPSHQHRGVEGVVGQKGGPVLVRGVVPQHNPLLQRTVGCFGFFLKVVFLNPMFFACTISLPYFVCACMYNVLIHLLCISPLFNYLITSCRIYDISFKTPHHLRSSRSNHRQILRRGCPQYSQPPDSRQR